MSIESRDRIRASLGGAAGIDASTAKVSDAILASCRALEAELAPVLGYRGVAALYKRSLHLVAAEHPWLPGVQEDHLAPMDLEPLRQAIARQNGADAADAGADLLQTFHDLLASLVGRPLGERLLRSVGSPFTSSPPGQDTSP